MTRAQNVPGALRCLLLLTAADAATRVLGLRRTLALVSRVGLRPRAVDGDIVVATARSVAVAAAFYPRRALCLEQSIALFILLRRRGIAAELKLGVQPRPFYAHAWVEVDGAAVNEPDDLPLNMATFPLLGV